MRLKCLLVGAVVAFSLSGCVTMSEAARSVQVHSQVSNLLDDCKKLGPVTATAPRVWGPDQAKEEAKARLREDTARRKGDTVAILNMDVLLTEVTIQGVAFKCY